MKVTALFSVLCGFLLYLPLILNLIGRIREAFDPEKIPEVIKAFQELIAKMTPPAPTAESTGTTPANSTGEKKQRWRRLKTRLDVAGAITDTEAQEFCSTYRIDREPYV
jgi:hypothetical protein